MPSGAIVCHHVYALLRIWRMVGTIRQGPSMYEMEGPCPVQRPRTAGRPAARSANLSPGRRPTWRGQSPSPSCPPGRGPAWSPVLVWMHFYARRGPPHKGFRVIFMNFPAVHMLYTCSSQLSSDCPAAPPVHRGSACAPAVTISHRIRPPMTNTATGGFGHSGSGTPGQGARGQERGRSGGGRPGGDADADLGHAFPAVMRESPAGLQPPGAARLGPGGDE